MLKMKTFLKSTPSVAIEIVSKDQETELLDLHNCLTDILEAGYTLAPWFIEEYRGAYGFSKRLFKPLSKKDTLAIVMSHITRNEDCECVILLYINSTDMHPFGVTRKKYFSLFFKEPSHYAIKTEPPIHFTKVCYPEVYKSVSDFRLLLKL